MIYLKKLNPKIHANKEYLGWMNSFEIHKYTEQKYKKHTIKDIKRFIIDKNKSRNEFLYGIFLKKKHLGNIKLGPVDFFHKRAEISLFIGNQNYTGKGFASLAVRKIIDIAKKKRIKKLKAGVYSINKESIKLFLKLKFKKEGTLTKDLIFNKKRYDSIIFGKLI
jgi:RimJ/RimL family protein N-acetyltransferase